MGMADESLAAEVERRMREPEPCRACGGRGTIVKTMRRFAMRAEERVKPESDKPQTFEEALHDMIEADGACPHNLGEHPARVRAAHAREVEAAREAKQTEIVGWFQRLRQPAGSPPPLAPREFVLWIVECAEAAAEKRGRAEAWREAAQRVQAHDFSAGNLAIDDPPEKAQKRYSLALEMLYEEFERRANLAVDKPADSSHT